MARTKPTKTAPVAPGARMQTNTRFAAMFTPPVAKPWHGVVVRAHTPMEGCWTVRVDGIVPLQFINEAYLEVEQ